MAAGPRRLATTTLAAASRRPRRRQPPSPPLSPPPRRRQPFAASPHRALRHRQPSPSPPPLPSIRRRCPRPRRHDGAPTDHAHSSAIGLCVQLARPRRQMLPLRTGWPSASPRADLHTRGKTNRPRLGQCSQRSAHEGVHCTRERSRGPPSNVTLACIYVRYHSQLPVFVCGNDLGTPEAVHTCPL